MLLPRAPCRLTKKGRIDRSHHNRLEPIARRELLVLLLAVRQVSRARSGGRRQGLLSPCRQADTQWPAGRLLAGWGSGPAQRLRPQSGQDLDHRALNRDRSDSD